MIVSYDASSYCFVVPIEVGRSARSRAKSSKTGHKTAIATASAAGGGWCFSCSPFHMETQRWLQHVALLLTLLLLAAPAQARGPERVRGDSEDMRRLILSGLQRSPTFSAMVDRLEASDLIVEVQCGQFKSAVLAGRTVLLSARPSVRYVLVEIACPMAQAAALEILGHELRHALEIASAPWVVDEPSLEKLYTQIGFLRCPNAGIRGDFETEEARDAGTRVHHELFHPAASTRRVAHVTTK
jgi:hypothetical protein